MFCILVPMHDLGHVVETIFHLHLLQTASEKSFQKHESLCELDHIKRKFKATRLVNQGSWVRAWASPVFRMRL